MNARKLGAILLIVAGTAGLVFGTFGLGRDTQKTSIGSLEIAVSQERTFSVPVWVGVGAIAAGAFLLLAGRKGKA